ncbi:MAG: DNA primase, partial [Candidatus Omnitrophica bacterium]|nr:DNA primase [Candidatus Omnitrophota bacterium]
MIPQNVLDEIQDRSDIVEVVSQYAALKRSGRNFKGCCPFHTEKTPSFMVSPDKQIFHCFGCGVGGNVFSFLMKIDNLDFREAVRRLADRAGVILPEDSESRRRDDLSPFLEANRMAEEFFRSQLATVGIGSVVRKYIEQRGIGDEALSKYGIGFSPQAWDGFLKHARPKNSVPTLVKAGLVLERQDGEGHYDRFRNRLMFPIRNVKGDTVGFGARVLDDSVPKYLNSPETPVYQKGRVLYGFYEALDAIRREDRVVITEGYMDVVACFQAGVSNAVASSGTALTPEQIRLIKRYTKRVVLLFDADEAGREAALRGLDLLIEEGMLISVVTLPGTHDPDSFVKEFGADRFRAALDELGKGFFDTKFEALARKADLATAEGKAVVSSEMLASLRRVPDEVLKAGWIRELSAKAGIPERALWAELDRAGSGLRAAALKVTAAIEDAEAAPAVTLAEKMLLGLMLTFSDVWSEARSRISPQDFLNDEARRVAECVLGAQDWEEVQPSRILNHLSENEGESRLVRDSVCEVSEIPDAVKAFEDCWKTLCRKRREEKIRDLRSRIVECERLRDTAALGILLKEFAEVTRTE